MAWAVAGLYRLRREDSFIVGLVKEIAHIIRAIGWPRRKR
jgi:hypothetical protein